MIEIREMQYEDVEAVSQIEEECFSMPWGRQDFWNMVQNPTAKYLVAIEDHKIVGVSGVLDMAGDGDITNVAVTEAARGKGIATKLLKRLFELAQSELGIKDFTLEVRAGNAAAIHVYEKLGFEGVGYRKNFYEKPKEDALIMWKREK